MLNRKANAVPIIPGNRRVGDHPRPDPIVVLEGQRVKRNRPLGHDPAEPTSALDLVHQEAQRSHGRLLVIDNGSSFIALSDARAGFFEAGWIAGIGVLGDTMKTGIPGT